MKIKNTTYAYNTWTLFLHTKVVITQKRNISIYIFNDRNGKLLLLVNHWLCLNSSHNFKHYRAKQLAADDRRTCRKYKINFSMQHVLYA